jgi:hypothetical protein
MNGWTTVRRFPLEAGRDRNGIPSWRNGTEADKSQRSLEEQLERLVRFA